MTGDDALVAVLEGFVLPGRGAAGGLGRVEEACQGGEVLRLVAGGAAGEQDAHAVGLGVPDGGLQHGGAAGAGGAAQQDEAAGAGAGAGRLRGDQLEHVRALAQRAGHARLPSSCERW
ncbi:hypothetical protein B0E37_06275 [Streptomyces sp. MH192]|nr:hypothetical protein [Streptomyces sp. MH192]MCF0103701.1 hypothetical protein [Streptomyces sp. MH191]